MSLHLAARRGVNWCTTQRCPAILTTRFAASTGGASVNRPSALFRSSYCRTHARPCVNARAVDEPDDPVMLENNSEPSTTRRFFGCYLLASQSPKAKGRTYIGYLAFRGPVLINIHTHPSGLPSTPSDAFGSTTASLSREHGAPNATGLGRWCWLCMGFQPRCSRCSLSGHGSTPSAALQCVPLLRPSAAARCKDCRAR